MWMHEGFGAVEGIEGSDQRIEMAGRMLVESAPGSEPDAMAKSPGEIEDVLLEHEALTKDAEELVFTLATTDKSPPGNHKTLRCRAIVTENGEPITHMFGPGELRIFRPPPPKPDEAAKPKPEPKPAEKKPVEKPLSRLEQLRQTKQQGTD